LNPADPSTPGSGLDSYNYAVSGYVANFRAFPRTPNLAKMASFTDGTSNTIAFTTKYARCGIRLDYYNNDWSTEWMYGPEWDSFSFPVYPYWTSGVSTIFQVQPTGMGANPTCDYPRPQSPHPGGILVALADGSVRFVSASIPPELWWAATTPNGGE